MRKNYVEIINTLDFIKKQVRKLSFIFFIYHFVTVISSLVVALLFVAVRSVKNTKFMFSKYSFKTNVQAKLELKSFNLFLLLIILGTFTTCNKIEAKKITNETSKNVETHKIITIKN